MDFSFIIPVYNCRKTLSACVQSILQAQIPNSEILLIDDGSTDGSAQFCDTLGRRYPQIHVTHQSNRGAAAARNAGLSSCTGSRILFADADDTFDPTALKKLLSGQRCDQTDLTIFGMEFCYYHRGRHTNSEFCNYGTGDVLSSDTWEKDLSKLFHTNALSSLCNKIFNRDLIAQHHLRLNPELTVYEDLDFVLRYLSFCNRILTISEPVYRYYIPADSRKRRSRLVQLKHIPSCMEPIAASLHLLMEHKPGISRRSCEQILESLYLMLAQQKMTVTDIAGIRQICLDYICWEDRILQSPTPSVFRNRICSMDIYTLWSQHKLGALRYRLGIWYRWLLSFLKGGTNGH